MIWESEMYGRALWTKSNDLSFQEQYCNFLFTEIVCLRFNYYVIFLLLAALHSTRVIPGPLHILAIGSALE